MMVFCAEITITGRPGRARLIFGNWSSPLPSGMMTSEITRSPLPSSTQRISVTSDEVAWTLHPARVSACVRTVRIVRSSSATRTVPSIRLPPGPGPDRAQIFGASGSDTRKTVRPGTESTDIQPPFSAVSLATRARPRPVPFSRPDTKGSNTSAAMSGGRPGPSSMISTCTGRRLLRAVRLHPAQRGFIERVQPDHAARGPASEAFLRRLRKICRSWSPSAQTDGSEGS
jgi:hypothetical protein